MGTLQYVLLLYLPLKYSIVLSITRFNKGSKPLRIPETSLPPENLTLIALSRYFLRSKIDSFFFFSFCSPAKGPVFGVPPLAPVAAAPPPAPGAEGFCCCKVKFYIKIYYVS